MPLLGLGCYRISEGEALPAVRAAAKEGYRLFDTASAYKNEEALGKAFASLSLPRKDFFVTSKVWNNAQRLGDVEGAFARSLERLKLAYVDLYLIHWPVPGCTLATWEALERLLASGRTRAIGVCNFTIADLEELGRVSGTVPAVNQIEVHPLCYPKELIEYCQSRGIQVQAYAPLARGAYLENDFLCVLATKYAKTPSQIGLRYLIQRGIGVIPRSVNPQHLAANADLWSFNLSDEDMAVLDDLNEDLHFSSIPEDLRDSYSY